MGQPVGVTLRYYVDEDLSDDLSTFLRGLGYDAIHTREVGNARRIDPLQLAHAARQQRVLLTANFGDFRMLHEAWLTWTADSGLTGISPHAGIIVLPNPNTLDAAALAAILAEFAHGVEPADLRNRLLRYRTTVGWEDLSIVRGWTVPPS